MTSKKARRRSGDHALLILRALRAGIGRLDAPVLHLELDGGLYAIRLDEPDGWVLSEYGRAPHPRAAGRDLTNFPEIPGSSTRAGRASRIPKIRT